VSALQLRRQPSPVQRCDARDVERAGLDGLVDGGVAFQGRDVHAGNLEFAGEHQAYRAGFDYDHVYLSGLAAHRLPPSDLSASDVPEDRWHSPARRTLGSTLSDRSAVLTGP